MSPPLRYKGRRKCHDPRQPSVLPPPARRNARPLAKRHRAPPLQSRTMNAPPIQYVATAEGLNIAYSVTGSGRCVIYMGLPINHIQLAWHNEKDLLSALAMHWSLVQCDQRGQGLSSRA